MKHLKEEGERYQIMRVADQTAGLAGVTLACTVPCEELKQNNIAIPVENLMSRERSLCVPGGEHNLLEMARANKVALDMLSGYTSSGVMRIRNGSTGGLLVPGPSPTPGFGYQLATLGECRGYSGSLKVSYIGQGEGLRHDPEFPCMQEPSTGIRNLIKNLSIELNGNRIHKLDDTITLDMRLHTHLYDLWFTPVPVRFNMRRSPVT